ncbi:MAG: hypothetical protein ACO2OS_03505 [Thermosphaera aggregans]|uniref:hypothetical protein n=1 Tax=Thermosphaera aggregans TaxID=54254 RepID=UPI003BFE603A
MRIDIEAPVDWILGGAKNFVPDIYFGLEKLEVGKPYRATLKYSPIQVPRGRKKNAVIAVYAALYKIPAQESVHIKLGTHSLFYDTAGMIWAQGSLHARIIGIFRLKKQQEEGQLEQLEEMCRKFLAELHSEWIRGMRVRFDTSVPRISNIVNVWASIESISGRMESLVDVMMEIADECFDRLVRVEWVEPLYDNIMWFSPPLGKINVEDRSIKPGLPVEQNKRRQDQEIEGIFTITPMGLCSFIESGGITPTLYIDRCRNFIYNFEVLNLREEGIL